MGEPKKSSFPWLKISGRVHNPQNQLFLSSATPGYLQKNQTCPGALFNIICVNLKNREIESVDNFQKNLRRTNKTRIRLRNIENLENKNSNDIKFIDLKINTQKIKKIHSKDSKGDPNKYKIEIKTVLEIEFENDINLKKNFFVSDIFDDFESQFELNKYEKKTTKILTERLSEKIIVYLRTIE